MTYLLAALAFWLFVGLWLTTNKATYPTPTSSTGGVTSLASSATWVAGYEWFVIDNTTELALDYLVTGTIRIGTSPTANTEIRIYLVASYDGSTWPDVFDGTPSAETVTSVGVRNSFAKKAASLDVDATTSDRDYPFAFAVAQFFGGVMPKKVAVFVTHNCSPAALHATGSNHTYAYAPYDTTNSG